MNLVDSSAWLEYFADGPNASHFAPVVQQPDRLIVPAVVIYEVFKVVLRESGENAAMQVCGAMQKGRVVDLDLKLALAAGKLSLALSLPMADAMILATARELGATIWTLDADFREIPGVKYFPKK
ncbi:MAG TPA: type II toxin-antitoxin system VapC family toxin [candidate division Zixibacteria bacterium]|nr:type II toxin-antitoxin system VapC family toxin [candidate division Zixibacteria bacterium]